MSVARRRGVQKAKVAVARKLAVVLHRMWWGGRTSAGLRPKWPDFRKAATGQHPELLRRGGGPYGDSGSGLRPGKLERQLQLIARLR